MLATSENLSSNEKAALSASIKSMSEGLSSGKLEEKLAKELSTIDSNENLDEFKTQLYTKNHLTDLAKSAAWQSYEQEYKDNPYFQADMKKQELQLNKDKFAVQQQQWEKEYQLDQLKFQFQQYESANKVANEKGASIIVTPGGLDTHVTAPTIQEVEKELSDMRFEKTTLANTYAGALATDDKGNSFARVKVVNGRTVPDDEATAKAKNEYLTKLASAYAINPSSITKDNNSVREYLEQNRALDIKIAQKNQLYMSTKTDKSVTKYDDEINAVVKDMPGLKGRDGKTIFSAKDLLSVANEMKNFTSSRSAIGAPTGGGSAYDSQLDKEKFWNTYKGTHLQPVAVAMIKANEGKALTETEKVIVANTKYVHNTTLNKIGEITRKKRQAESDYLALRMPEKQIQVGTISPDNANDQNRISMLLGLKANDFAKNGSLDSDQGKDYDPQAAYELSQLKGVVYTIEKKFDGSGYLTAVAGNKRQVVPMTASEVEKFIPKAAISNDRANDIRFSTLGSPHHSTGLVGDFNDPSAAINARFSGYDLRLLANTKLANSVRMNVEGNPMNTGVDSDTYQIRMFAQKGDGTWVTKIINNEGFISLGAVLDAMDNKIGSGIVQEVLKSN